MMNGDEARGIIEDSVRRELFGPLEGESPRGQPLDCSSGSVRFSSKEESWGTWHDSTTLQEILTESDPVHRYGVGVLHGDSSGRGSSGAVREQAGLSNADDEDLSWVTGLPSSEEFIERPSITVNGKARHDELDSDDFDLTDANSFKPSAMAVSFKVAAPQGSALEIRVTGAYYDTINVEIGGGKEHRVWWLRRPIEFAGTIFADSLVTDSRIVSDVLMTSAQSSSPRIVPNVQIFSRVVPKENDTSVRLLTVAVSNKTPRQGPSTALFQVGFTVEAKFGSQIMPYPESSAPASDEEEQSIDLLFRHKKTFAIGHGCAADWEKGPQDFRTQVSAVALPEFEVESLTPDAYVLDESGKRVPLSVSMDELAKNTHKGKLQIEGILHYYERWIVEREGEIAQLDPRLQPAAIDHMQQCRVALERMLTGWRLLAEDPLAAKLFQIANSAMHQQQIRSRLPIRSVKMRDDGITVVEGKQPVAEATPLSGNWRPFQIAFILACLPEIIHRNSERRELVDLIFFPTGGGKTEAYLGAAAISLVSRRLRNPLDSGTDTLMRYTLRLLTAQQFLRAASLICVLEDIRSKNSQDLGETRFGIGIWLGGTSTPNTWKQATEALKKMKKDHWATNMFLLLRCPWCGTQMGTKPSWGKGQDVFGYEEVRKKVIFRCPDRACRFGGRESLPIHVVDEDIYDVRPSIVIGTVDKFAMLAWRPNARSIFGLGGDGSRVSSPPGLIIQDELHLISGPLGSMVGLYEPVIDELSTDRRGVSPIVPKIIASTATIRRYQEQIQCLFGRSQVALFPPHGLEDGHSFFAEPNTYEDGSAKPGTRYLGVFSASLGSTQTVQVRVAAATLQGATAIPLEGRDGYWTNLNFLNSLRELGNTVSLLQSDVPDYLTGLRRRDSLDEPRWPRNNMELTSRRRSDEIPMAIQQLQVSYGSPECIDICLASNIIEVGVDINRLGLMTIVGQPKTTAQYIQVSGRVGRQPEVSPGLVITIYGAAKPRDRSHYERFRTYHERLYAQVEPTSVTPFATPVLRRAFHAAIVSFIRQTSPSTPPHPFPTELYNYAFKLLEDRARLADVEELPALKQIARGREREWRKWERTAWDANSIGGDPQQGLMRYAGTLSDPTRWMPSWEVPTSMRNVDAECRLQITLEYNRVEVDGDQGEL